MRPLAAIGRSAPHSGEVGDSKLRDPVVEAGNGPPAASAWNRPVERISQLGYRAGTLPGPRCREQPQSGVSHANRRSK